MPFDLLTVLFTRLDVEVNGFNGGVLNGVPSAYHWYTEQYGVKGPCGYEVNISSQGDNFIQVDFDTPWCQPESDVIAVLSRRFSCTLEHWYADPPYLVGFRDRQGRTIAGDKTDEWLQPACNEMYRVLKKDALMVSFYGWNRVDRFMAAWKNAGFSVVGHLVFTKTYTSKAAYVGYRHECAYILAKGRPALPQKPLPDVLGWKYSGNRHHPTEKPVIHR